MSEPSPAAASSYAERFAAMWYLCGPGSWSSLLASDADVRAAGRTVAAADAPGGAAGGTSAAEVLRARRLLAAVVHPDTHEPIALPLRMAAHVPVNALLLVGMLSARSVLATGAWQAVNQGFNGAQGCRRAQPEP